MALRFQQRKVVNVLWDTGMVKGMSASIEASSEEQEETIEVRTVANDGSATITFPNSFKGPCAVVVRGSKGGEQSGTVNVD